jgi:hypothetical protein
MIHYSDNFKEIVSLDTIPLKDVLLDRHLGDELLSLGVESSCDLWVLALGEAINPHSDFSDLLSRISQDFAEQMDFQERGQYKTKIEFSSVAAMHNVNDGLQAPAVSQPSRSTSVRVSLRMRVSRSNTVHWAAQLPDSYLSQDVTSGFYDDMPKRDFCLHFLCKADDGDIAIEHRSEPPANAWQSLLPKPAGNIFGEWLNSPHPSQRDLSILEERMGLRSGKRKTLEEVGQEFNITRERVRQIAHRFLRQLYHPGRRRHLAPFRTYLTKLFHRHGGIMTLDETSRDGNLTGCFERFSPRPSLELILHCAGPFRALDYDYESGHGASDTDSVTWHLLEVEPESIRMTRRLAFSLISKDPCRYSFEELVKIVSSECNVPTETTKASLRTYQSIEQGQDGLMIRTGGAKHLTVPAMALIVLRETGVPLHFTAMTEEVNKRFPERNVSPNHVLNSLDTPIFRWVGRGTYGLAEWGLPEIKPRENYAAAKEAIQSFLQELNRPAKTVEIEAHLNRLRDEDPNFTLLSRPCVILQNNPRLFVYLGQSEWGLVRWNMIPKAKADAVSLACRVLAEDETAWLTSQQLFVALKSRGWTGPFPTVQRALDREVAKQTRRIQKMELHGFHIQLYGLSSRKWNEEAVLQELLSD